ncbi:hypothetical protein Dimus_013410, partial [Dionaea muscipula]
MARRQKPSSKCTSNVAGLNTAASDESDLGKLFSIKPLEEESGRISDDDRCLPSIGKSSSSESTMDDVATELDDVIADLEPISGDHQLPTDLGFPESLLPLDSAHDLYQVNPNLSISRSDMDPSGSSIAKPRDYSLNVIANSAILDERACPRENECSSHNPTEHENVNDNAMGSPTARPPDNFKGKWSNLFADNRKPIEDFMLKKVDFQPSDGCLDFSDETLAANFMFETPFCLIGYFFGNFPGVMALRRLCDSWAPVLVQNTKTHDPGAIQTCLNPNPPPEPPTDVGTELPGDSLAQAPILLTESCPPGCSSAEQPIPKPTCDTPQHEHSIRQLEG